MTQSAISFPAPPGKGGPAGAGVYTEDRYLTGGMPDISKMRPFILTMPDNRYRMVGEEAGNAWDAGLKLKLKQQE